MSVASLEAIQHQKDTGVFKMMTQVINTYKIDKDRSVLLGSLTELVKFTGMSVNFNILEGYVAPIAYITVPDLNGAHSLTNDLARRRIDKKDNDVNRDALWKKTEKDFMSIDREKVKVTGLGTKVPFVIYFTDGLLTKLTNEEVAAVLLHELGHAWTYLELLTVNIYTNQALLTARDTFLNGSPVSKVNLLRTMGVKGTTIEQVENFDEDTYIATVATRASQRIDDLRKDTKRTLYDRSSSEYLADQFATRMGAGLHLIKAMDKLTTDNPTYYKYRMTSWSVSIAKILGAALLAGPHILVSAGVFGLLFSMYDKGRAYGGEYDTLPDKFKRIKHQLIDSLKDPNVPTELRKATLNNLDEIDKLISEKNTSIKLGRFVLWLTSSTRRDSFRYKKAQQLLEEMANNALYASAARLKQ